MSELVSRGKWLGQVCMAKSLFVNITLLVADQTLYQTGYGCYPRVGGL